MSVDQNMLQTFAEESFDRLARIAAELEHLSDQPDDLMESIHSLFRETHNLKGAANLVGVRAVEQLAHCLEGILDQARSGEELMDEQLLALLQAGYERIGELLNNTQVLPLVDASREIVAINGHLEKRRGGC
jgi:two-component system chemotaxis sensor kinase CheA